MKILDYMEAHGHEQLCVFTDKGVGLRAFIAIHDTTLGPSLGGVRIWPHKTEEEAILDVLRLSRGMTYKSASAGLNQGGGKALIIASSQEKTEAMMRAFGRFVESLGGRYITTEDVGATTRDMEWISQETSHVTGLPVNLGGSGDPSEMTGYGVYQGMKACAAEAWGNDSLRGRVVALQGFGNVASYLTHHLLEEGARLVVTDINQAALKRAREGGLEVLEDPLAIYDVECDIFSPCALGGILNDGTIPRLRCKVVAGSANNQLLEDSHARVLQQRGILYAPDYIINAGGVINISLELGQPYDEEAAMQKTTAIYDTMARLIDLAKTEGITTAQAADHVAEERIAAMRRVKGIYLT
ncbi:MAG: Glu/Leu/Phe/Val dehydrogenase [Chloroflexi bacterium]|nr:Glu/Leu/Phe/Val dehydrogenase [Chloroflexota bacterium]